MLLVILTVTLASPSASLPPHLVTTTSDSALLVGSDSANDDPVPAVPAVSLQALMSTRWSQPVAAVLQWQVVDG